MTGLHLSLPARRLSAEQALNLGSVAEASGWTGIWASEVFGLDALVLLGALAPRTSCRLGTAVVPVTTRSAAVLAMAASTIEQMAAAGFTLGLGVSTDAIVGSRHDRAVTSPLAEVSGALEVIRRAVRGERVDHPRSPAVTDLRIEVSNTVPRVALGALGPRMTRLAVTKADGLILTLLPFEEAQRRAREAAAHAAPSFETFLQVRVAVDPDTETLHALRRELAGYMRVSAYRRQLQAAGIELEAVHSADNVNDAAAHVSDEALHELAVVGSAEHCRQRLALLERAGVTPLVIPIGDEQRREHVVRALPGA